MFVRDKIREWGSPRPFSDDARHSRRTHAFAVSANRRHHLETRRAAASATTRRIYNADPPATATTPFLDRGQKEKQGSIKPCLFADAGAGGNAGATQPAAPVNAVSDTIGAIVRQ